MAGTIKQRIALDGGAEIRKELAELGSIGEAAFRKLEKAAKDLKGPDDSFSGRLRAIQKDIEAVGRKFAEVGEKMRNIGAGMSLAITAPVTLLGKSFIDAASEAQEMQSALSFLFGQNTKDVQEWSRTLGQEIGRSSTELQKQATAFMQLFKQVQPNQKAATDLSTTFAKLAQDLASFYNVTEDDALAKLRSGLSGEAEPMRDFGVFMSEAAVSAQGLKMGLGGLTGELTEQEKVLARAQLILESTKDAQGDAARTSDSYANKVRALSAAWSDLSITIGTILLPLATQVVTVLADVVNAFGTLDPTIQTAILAIAGLAAVAGPLLITLGLIATGFNAIAPALALVVTAFTGLGTAITGIGTVLAALAAGLASFPVLVGAAFVAGLAAVFFYFDEIKASAGAAWDWIAEGASGIGEKVAAGFRSGIDAIKEAWNGLLKFIEDIWEKATTIVKDAIAAIANVIKRALALKDKLTGKSSGEGSGVASGADGFATGGFVSGPGTSTSDSIPAWLSAGEFVLTAKAVRKYGLGLLYALNSLQFDPKSFKKFASGGIVQGFKQGLPAFAGGGLVNQLASLSAGSGAALTPINLSIFGESMGQVLAPESVASNLQRYAQRSQLKSAGRKPGWY